MSLQAAKIAIRKAIGTIVKDQYQSHYKFKYLSHDQVTDVVVGAMHEYGVTHQVSCTSVTFEGGYAVLCVDIDFKLDKESEATGWYAADKVRDGTTMGSLTSYAVKTGLLKYFGIPTGEKDLEEHKPSKAPEFAGRPRVGGGTAAGKMATGSPEPDIGALTDKLEKMWKDPAPHGFGWTQEDIDKYVDGHGGSAFWLDPQTIINTGREFATELKKLQADVKGNTNE